MAGKKKINVFIIYDKEVTSKNIPADMNDVELKGYLRDLGFISSYRRSYLTTKVYLVGKDGEEDKEICMGEGSSLEELGITEGRTISIEPGEPEPVEEDFNDCWAPRRYLYGCPMAHSVKEAANQAEKYSKRDSIVENGFIPKID